MFWSTCHMNPWPKKFCPPFVTYRLLPPTPYLLPPPADRCCLKIGSAGYTFSLSSLSFVHDHGLSPPLEVICDHLQEFYFWPLMQESFELTHFSIRGYKIYLLCCRLNIFITLGILQLTEIFRVELLKFQRKRSFFWQAVYLTLSLKLSIILLSSPTSTNAWPYTETGSIYISNKWGMCCV